MTIRDRSHPGSDYPADDSNFLSEGDQQYPGDVRRDAVDIEFGLSLKVFVEVVGDAKPAEDFEWLSESLL